jgi:hypothetical protein
MRADVRYEWESLPEYIATQEYSRCLGRIIKSLPRRARLAVPPLTLAAVRLGTGIAGCNAEMPPGQELSPEERASFRSQSMEGLETSRRRIRRLQRRRLGDRAEIRHALELLDRIERWIQAGPPAGGPPN